MPTDQKFLEWLYPAAGIDVRGEFQEQPALTTPAAVNVRAFEPSSDRGRGGSRPGLSKYIADQLPAGSHLVQHLQVIVDPQGPLLGLSFSPDDPTVLDTSSGGRGILDDGTTRKIRDGGSGYYTHPEADQDDEEPDPGAIELVQSSQHARVTSSAANDVLFDAEPATNNLAVAVVFTSTADAGDDGLQVSSLATNGEYTQAGSYRIAKSFGSNAYFTVSIWYRIVGTGVGEQTVRVTPVREGSMVVVLMEYDRVLTSSPLDGTNGNNVNDQTPDATMTPGVVPVNGTGEVVVGAFVSGLATDTHVPGAGYTAVEDHPEGVSDSTDLQCVVIHQIGLSADAEPTVTYGSAVGQQYAAAGASFKWQGF